MRSVVLGCTFAWLGACMAPSHEPSASQASASRPEPSGRATSTASRDALEPGEPSTNEAEPSEAQAREVQPVEPAEPAEPEFVAATHGSGGCIVTVSALLEATEYRGGSPMTPALAASLDADPEFARRYNSASHGDHHIQCVYRVELAHEPGKHYRWLHWFNNLLRDAEPSKCKTLAAEVAQDIVRTTKDCTQLDAGAWWGQVLEPLP